MGTPSSGEVLVEVWWASTGLHDWLPWTRMLNSDERQRLRALQRTDDRERFVLAALLCRAALATRLGVGASDVALDRNCPTCSIPHGKPRLAAPSGDLEVSITHSGALVGVALAPSVAVGLDVERIRRIRGIAKLEAGVLGARDLVAYQRALHRNGRNRSEAFLRVWTRKEALAKMAELGIRAPLEGFSVSPPDTVAQCLSTPEGILGDRVVLHDLEPPVDGYVAAVAAAHPRATPVSLDGSSLLSTIG